MKFAKMILEIEIVPRMEGVKNHVNVSMKIEGFRANFAGTGILQKVNLTLDGVECPIEISSCGNTQFSIGKVFLPGVEEKEQQNGSDYLNGHDHAEILINTPEKRRMLRATIEGCCRCFLEQEEIFSSRYKREKDKGDTVVYFIAPNFAGFERARFSYPIRNSDDVDLLSKHLEIFI